MSILASASVVICLARVYFLMMTTTSTSSGTPSRSSIERDDDVLPRSALESIHVWLLAAAFCSLLGPPIAPLLLSSAVYVGATIKPKVWDGKGDIFYKLSAGQQRHETDY